MPIPYRWRPKTERLQRDIEEEQQRMQWWQYPLDFLARGTEQTFTTMGALVTAPWRAKELGELAGDFPIVSPWPGGRGYKQYEEWRPTSPSMPVGIPSWRQWGTWIGKAMPQSFLAAEEPVPKGQYEQARLGMAETGELAPLFLTGGLGPKTATEKLTAWARAGMKPRKLPAELRPKLPKEPKARPIKVEEPQPPMAPEVPESALDRAASQYLETGNFDDFIYNMPVFKKLSEAEAKELGVALRTTPRGKVVPAMRESGFSVTEEFANAQFKDIGIVSGRWQDPTRMMQAIDAGKFGGALQRNVLWPTQRTTIASLKFVDTFKYRINTLAEESGMLGKKELRQKAGDVIQHISQKEVIAPPAQRYEILRRPEIQKLIGKYPAEVQERIVAFAQKSRQLFDELITKQNLARGKRKQELIQYRQNYRPWVIESNIWSKMFGLKKLPNEVMQSPMLPDYIVPTKPFNPRALAREGGLYNYEKERDLIKLLNDYVETSSKDIFNTNIVHNAKVHSAQLRSMGYANASRLIEDWAAEAYAGVAPRFSRAARELVGMRTIKPMLWLRRRLTAAVFPLNWTWNMFVQTSSGALTMMRYGVRNSMQGMDYIFSSKAREETWKNAYSQIIKGRQAGSVAYQDLTAGIEKNLALQGSKIEKAEHFANIITTQLERLLTGVSVRAAYHDGLKKGLKKGSRELWQYASEGGSKTQSMYNLQDVPGVLRAREVGALVPFQTFAFEVMNSVRELNIIGIRRLVGKAGAYETTSAKSILGEATIQKRLKMLGEWIAAFTAVNVVVDNAINRKPWSTSSFIPFFAVLTGGVNAGNPWNQVLPLRYSQEVYNGINSLVKYGDWKKLRKWAIRYHMIGGVQVERMLSGLEAVIEGRVTDVRGETLFEVEPEEWWRAIFMGAYSTEGGKEYLDKFQESKGFGYEYTGIPVPKLPETGQLKKVK